MPKRNTRIEDKIMTDKEKDICKTCKNYWCDFPLPLERYVPHCMVLDKDCMNEKSMDEVVPYPCTKCPFDSYVKDGKS